MRKKIWSNKILKIIHRIVEICKFIEREWNEGENFHEKDIWKLKFRRIFQHFIRQGGSRLTPFLTSTSNNYAFDVIGLRLREARAKTWKFCDY